MKKINKQDWKDMQPSEQTAYGYSVLGFEAKELARLIAEFEFEEGKQPNAIFISHKTLAKIPTRVKKVVGLTVIPMEADEEKFIISQVDPWDQRWEHLFYS